MTTITTGASGPKAWKIALVAGAVGLVAIVAMNLPQAPTDTTGPQVAETAPVPVPVPDQATVDLLAPVITQEFLDGPSSITQNATRVDPRAAAAVGLDPGAIDAVVGGTTHSAAVPDQATVDLLAPVITQEFLDGPSSITQNATRVDPRAAAAVGLDPGAIDAVVGGTTHSAAVPNPADLKFLEGQPEAGSVTEPHVPMANNLMR